jgi:hypothetical protein
MSETDSDLREWIDCVARQTHWKQLSSPQMMAINQATGNKRKVKGKTQQRNQSSER